PADDPGPPAGRVHPPGQAEAPRLHGRLGPPEAERPGAADRAVQGPLQVRGRARGAPDRPHVTPVRRALKQLRPTVCSEYGDCANRRNSGRDAGMMGAMEATARLEAEAALLKKHDAEYERLA